MCELKGNDAHKRSILDDDACSKGACRFVCQSDGSLGPQKSLEEMVEELLSCRGFLWDVMLDGKWTGCSGPVVKKLKERFGAQALLKVFE